jgi:hypothetical protein
MLEFLDSTVDVISIKYYVRFVSWIFTPNVSCPLVPSYACPVVSKFNLVVEKKLRLFELTL